MAEIGQPLRARARRCRSGARGLHAGRVRGARRTRSTSPRSTSLAGDHAERWTEVLASLTEKVKQRGRSARRSATLVLLRAVALVRREDVPAARSWPSSAYQEILKSPIRRTRPANEGPLPPSTRGRRSGSRTPPSSSGAPTPQAPHRAAATSARRPRRSSSRSSATTGRRRTTTPRSSPRTRATPSRARGLRAWPRRAGTSGRWWGCSRSTPRRGAEKARSLPSSRWRRSTRIRLERSRRGHPPLRSRARRSTRRNILAIKGLDRIYNRLGEASRSSLGEPRAARSQLSATPRQKINLLERIGLDKRRGVPRSRARGGGRPRGHLGRSMGRTTAR
jgi:hypothetical protein